MWAAVLLVFPLLTSAFPANSTAPSKDSQRLESWVDGPANAHISKFVDPDIAFDYGQVTVPVRGLVPEGVGFAGFGLTDPHEGVQNYTDDWTYKQPPLQQAVTGWDIGAGVKASNGTAGSAVNASDFGPLIETVNSTSKATKAAAKLQGSSKHTVQMVAT